MNNTAKSKRLDKIELRLTPKQWAIRLADEMRRYPSQGEFMKAIAKGTDPHIGKLSSGTAVSHNSPERAFA
jgi:hypothetical protein